MSDTESHCNNPKDYYSKCKEHSDQQDPLKYSKQHSLPTLQNCDQYHPQQHPNEQCLRQQ